MKEITITSLEAGQRLDRVLQKYLSRASAGFLYKMLRKKNITLNGKKAEGKEKLKEGDTIRLYFAQETLEKFAPQKESDDWPRTRLDIVYEDDQILLLDKPAGMLTQKAAPSDVSLNEYAIGYLLDSDALTTESLASFRPSVCNRLDRNTSGIVAVGKTTAALQELSAMFRDRTIHKYYQALVIGKVEKEATIDAYLVKDEGKNEVRIIPSQMSDVREKPDGNLLRQNSNPKNADEDRHLSQKPDDTIEGRRIRTRYIPLALNENDFLTEHENTERSLSQHAATHDLTLLEIELITGRTHQIRAHLSSVGHPIAGDPKYGSRRRNEYFAREYGLHRQLLHAGRIVFPQTDGILAYLGGRSFAAKLPEDFERVLAGERIMYGEKNDAWQPGIHAGFGEAPLKT